MSPLRQQMIDAMVLRGLARRTQEAYLSVVGQLAAHYHCSPDRLDAVQVKAWLLHRITELSVVTRFDVPLVTYRDGPQRAIAQCKRRQVTMTGGVFA